MSHEIRIIVFKGPSYVKSPSLFWASICLKMVAKAFSLFRSTFSNVYFKWSLDINPLFHKVTKMGRFESEINVWSGKTYVLQCFWRLFCLFLFFSFFFLLQELKSWSKPLIVFKWSTQAKEPNYSHWMITDFEIFAKKFRPLDLHFWTLWAPQSRSKPLLTLFLEGWKWLGGWFSGVISS